MPVTFTACGPATPFTTDGDPALAWGPKPTGSGFSFASGARLYAATLLGSPGAVVRRRQLNATAWPQGAIVSDNTLEQYVSRMRRKLAEVHSEARDTTEAHGCVVRALRIS